MKGLFWLIKFLRLFPKYARPALDFSSRQFSLSLFSELEVSAIANSGYTTQALRAAAFTEVP